jgi:transposase
VSIPPRAAVSTQLNAIFVSLELSRSTWPVTLLLPGRGERISRRSRRAKTDKPDGEALVCTLLAFRRGELRVCAMVTVPSAEDEDRRRGCRERRPLVVERIRHVIPKRDGFDSSRFGQAREALEHFQGLMRQYLRALV